MASKPRDLADRMSARKSAPSDGFVRETFVLPRAEARERARSFLKRYSKAAYMTEIEQWRELLQDGIEFTIRRLPSAD